MPMWMPETGLFPMNIFISFGIADFLSLHRRFKKQKNDREPIPEISLLDKQPLALGQLSLSGASVARVAPDEKIYL